MEVPLSNYNNLNLTEATTLQNILREKQNLHSLTKSIRTIAGADISLNLYSDIVCAGIVHRYPRGMKQSVLHSEAKTM
ncbi:hypothetical protein [Dyadobacter psychrotolerans]|uniref:hypothetical protein n=1 Tax=Dyadobacter psychrotolerans TaxID=2541721 RepID=UPI001E2909D3|nr:hypothetical protein [Dyadobacter psychrotolerans]